MIIRMFQAPVLPSVTLEEDPDTSSWGEAEEGYTWYNSTDHHKKMWNGTEIVLDA